MSEIHAAMHLKLLMEQDPPEDMEDDWQELCRERGAGWEGQANEERHPIPPSTPAPQSPRAQHRERRAGWGKCAAEEMCLIPTQHSSPTIVQSTVQREKGQLGDVHK